MPIRVAIAIALVALTLAVSGIPSGLALAYEVRLRVAAWNIRHGEGMDHAVDLSRIAEVIGRLDADVITLQEVDQGTDRTGRVDQVAVIAAQLGYRGIHGAHRPYQGGAYGNAVLTRLPVRASRTHRVPPAAGSALAVLEVEVEVPGLGPASVVSVHLAGSVDERMAQAEAVTGLFAAAAHPVILAGDFNGRPDDAAVAWLSARWRRLDKVGPRNTFPADRPDREIDFVMVATDAGLEAIDHRVIPEPTASDHRPILAVLHVAGRQVVRGVAAKDSSPGLRVGPGERHLLQHHADRAADSVRRRRPVHSVEPVPLAGRRRRPGRRSVCGRPRRRLRLWPAVGD